MDKKRQEFLSYLESQSNPAGTTNKNLQKQLNTYTGLTQQATALGLSNPQGTQQKGFLSGILPFLMRPQSAVLGGILGASSGKSLSNIANALTGKETFTGSQELPQLDANAPVAKRIERAILGLGIDIATDPLTYLTMGRGGTLRGAKAASATEAQTLSAAGKVLKPVSKPVEVSTETVGLGNATAIAQKEATNAVNLLSKRPVSPAGSGLTQPSLVLNPSDLKTSYMENYNVEAPGSFRIPDSQPATSGPSYLARQEYNQESFPGASQLNEVAPIKTTGIVEPTPLVEKIALAAGEGQLFAGGKGAKDAIKNTLLKEGYTSEDALRLSDDIFSKLTPEIRGATGIRIPFIGKDAAGNIVPSGESTTRQLLSTPGGGELTSNLGLQNVAETTRNVFNQYRSSKFFGGWSKMMNGKLGDEYAQVLNGKMDYADYRKLVKQSEKQALRDYNMDRAGSLVLSTAEHILQQAVNPEEAKKFQKAYYEMADQMVLRTGANADEIAGFESAQMLRAHGTNMVLNELADATQRAGANSMPLIDDYIARPLHIDELKLRASRGDKVKEYDVSAKRKLGTTVDEYGTTRQMNNSELNKVFQDEGIRPAGHKVFSEDPMEIAAHQYASLKKLSNSYNLLADLKELGSIVEARYGTKELLNPVGIVARVEKAKTIYAKITSKLIPELDAARAAGDLEKVKSIQIALDKIASQPQVINDTLAGINDIALNPQGNEKIQTLFNSIWDTLHESALYKYAPTDRQFKELFKRDGLFRTETINLNADELIAKGLVPLESSLNVRLPRGMTNMFASEAVKNAVEKYYVVQTNKAKGILGSFYDEVYKPYYTLFKTYATVGRPGGYHWRNLQGGFWNNWLGDVSSADHAKSADILIRQHDTNMKAIGAVNNVIAGKPSGLTADADKLAQYVAGIAGTRGGISTVEGELDQLTHFMLISDLSKIKLGDTDMATIYSAAMDNGIYRNNRTLEYMKDVAKNETTNVAEQMLNTKNVNLFSQKSRNELNTMEKLTNNAINNAYIRNSGKAADYSEKFLRMASFISGARRFGVADGGEAAAGLTKALHFDYQDLSDFERQYLKNIIPFYTWARHNVPLQFNSLLLQPGKIDKLGFVKDELQSQFGANGDQESMAQLVPSWMQDKLGFVSNLSSGGNPLVLAGGGFESPAYDLNRYLSYGLNKGTIGNVINQAVGSMNPLIKFGVETATGTSTFTRAPFSASGTPTPLNIGIPGLTFKDKEGKNRVSSFAMNEIKSLLPPVGMALNLIPGQERSLTNYMSTVGGAPVSTLSPSQASAELFGRTSKLSKQIRQAAYNMGADPQWLKRMIDMGATKEQIDQQIAMGYGNPTL
jgi:hypothetical protein